MKNIIKFAINNPVTVTMVVLGILLLGKISYDQLTVDLLPDLNNPRLFVEIKAGERPPEEIEKQWVKNMESMAIRQSDVTEVSSIIKAGSARITVDYAWKKDMDEAYLDLQKALTPFAQNNEITELKITQHDPNASPVILVTMWHQSISDMAELRKIAENFIRNELIRIEGVAEVSLSGQEKATLTINTDPYRLDAFGLTIDDVSNRIIANNQNISGGRISEMGLQYLVKSAGMLNSVADFENLIVGYKAVAPPTALTASNAATDERAPVYLKEIANVRFENARPENIVRINGERCIALSVYKEMRFNTVKVVDEVARQLSIIEQSLPGYRFQIITNQGTFIKNSIGELKNSAMFGIALAVIVLFVFLRRISSTLIVSIAIPISVVATFNLMFFTGLTLNIMTLGGLALGAGMLVDNAIVVIESIFQNRERGLSIRDAALTGAREVAGAVIASTVTTIVVFLPIVYLHGVSGELFKDQAWTVAFSLISSLFVALLVIPMLFDRLSGGGSSGSSSKRKTITLETKSVQMRWYGAMLRRVLRLRWLIIGSAALLIIFTVMILPLLGTEFMPRSESNSFTILAKMPEGTQLERTSSAVSNLEKLIYEITGDTLTTVFSHIGADSGSANAIFEGENTAMMKIILPPACPLTPDAIIAQFLQTAENPDGLELTVQQEENSLNALLGSESAPIVVEVKGEDLNIIAELADELKTRMTKISGIYNIMSSIEDGAPEVIISVNRTVAGINNISVSTIIEQLKQQLAGKESGRMEYRGEMRDIIIKVPDVTLNSIGSLVIKSGTKEFRLHEIATVAVSQAPKEIFRRNQSRIGKVMASMDADKSLDKAAQEIRMATADIELPTNYSITVTGEEEKRQESFRSLMFALLLSIVLVYMVLASQFESLLHPFTILLTIPLALIGAVLLFLITGSTLNMMGVIGIIMLAGIAVNNSILLVDRINQLKDNMSLDDAIVEAGQQRIRPVLMTTITTILALLPLMLSFGEGASLRSPMAMAVIGGLFTSTIMSLIVIPCVYNVFENLLSICQKK